MGWRYIAERAVTGEILDWDVALETDGPTWELSGPGSLNATVTPDVGALRLEDGRLLLEEWGTAIYAEKDGEIRWGGLVVRSSFEGEAWTVECSGFSTYPHGIPYLGEYVRVGLDPAEAFAEIWRHVQSWPDGDLGVEIKTTPTPLTLGTRAFATDKDGNILDYAIPHAQWETLHDKGWVGGPVRHVDVDDALWFWLIGRGFTRTEADPEIVVPPTTWDATFDWWEAALLNLGWVGGPVRVGDVDKNLLDYLMSHGWKGIAGDAAEQVYPPTANDAVLGGDTKVTEAEPYSLVWWEAKDCGDELDNLAKTAPFDYVEHHFWDGEQIRHDVQTYYPRAGRHRDDLVFVQNSNVTSSVAFTTTGDEYANEIVGIGAGEGREALRRTTATRGDGRLRRPYVFADKAVNDPTRLDALIREELDYRKAALVIESIDVVDHPNAPLGSWQLGDDILVDVDAPWLGRVQLWCRIIAWHLTGEATATLSLARSDSYNYGG